jgi:PAS domain S-box-containing protein
MNDQITFFRVSPDRIMQTKAFIREGKNTTQIPPIDYGNILDSFNDVIFIIDTAGYFVFVNKASEKRTGIPTQTFIGQHFSELIDPKYREFAQSTFQKAMNGEEVTLTEMQRETENGEKITQEVNWTSIYEDGIVVALLGVARDVTECKRAEAVLEGAREELEMRVRERTSELLKANELLEKEVKERKAAERRLKKNEKALKVKAKNLEEANAALKVILQRRKKIKQSSKRKWCLT